MQEDASVDDEQDEQGGAPSSPTSGPETTNPIVVISADPDQAWKALSLVNDWIKHAETKSVATLAAAGVSGGVLYNLLKDLNNPAWPISMLGVICGLSITCGGLAAAIALMPRLKITRRRSSGPTSPLYFNDIARTYAGNGPTYSDVLHALTGDPDALTRHIAHQVHANSEVARRKYFWANRAVAALVVGLLSVGSLAAVIGSAQL